MSAAAQLLTPRWTPLRYHPVQWRLRQSRARFKVVAAGRRSGKSENCKREGILAAIDAEVPSFRAVFGAPTHDQARDLFWEDVKALVPRWALRRPPLEGRLEIHLVNGAKIQVRGLDKPARIEGSPLDWIGIDEFADCRPDVWEAHVLPALLTDGRPPGRAWLLSVPEGKNHFFRVYDAAMKDHAEHGDASESEAFTWKSADILPAAEIERRKATMDPLTFAQEYEAAFANFAGRAYYTFDMAVHAAERVVYDPRRPLILCFDFNVTPGSAVIAQEQDYHAMDKGHRPEVLRSITAVIGEVNIPRNSNTPAVCERIIADWGPQGAIAQHQGEVYLYGDPTGGNRGSAKIAGTDWEQIRAIIGRVPGWTVYDRVPRRAGEERPRVNALNGRLLSADGKVGMLIDPVRCPQTIADCEGVVLLEGGTGQIDKDADPLRTHWTDGIGYYCERAHGSGRSEIES